MNFSSVRQDIESTPALSEALNRLYAHFIDTNSFEVPDRLVEEFDSELVTHYQLIEDEYGSGKRINPNSYFAYKLLLEQAPNVIDKAPASLAELQFCFEQLWENRPKEKPVMGISKLHDQLFQLLLTKGLILLAVGIWVSEILYKFIGLLLFLTPAPVVAFIGFICLAQSVTGKKLDI